ncbi:type I toxin-antitoxin system Hok family toxin [Escherichia coli]|nr:type I toxin-antitoxin system Hok family toxin [Escherichia coli]EJT2765873.1 type I toxin-antitoxin system Hok family toxin [Shigella sonnei]EKH5293409.1 type I toxin-antitoxin system Hok family toxin [Escherichia coli O26]EKH6183936.1 type I toxin-antitoxin system Hok family toxin [Escherichia coli O111]EKH6193247.1 type I toxin-antitoxin system Hok family toxin [Escherichia coli O103]EKJ1984427.1 type I toxin-antitoxin system Hok family toxin [Escherichia coli O104]EKY3871355.1 type I t
MNLAIQILASYPPSGKEKGYEAQPSGGVLLIICITILTFTLLTRQTLYELRFRDGDKEVAALMACTSR